MEMKNIKKTILPYALVGTMALSGCAGQVKTNTTEAPTQATTQATTENITEATTETIKYNDNEELEYYNEEPEVIAFDNTIYEDNKSFCATYDITPEEIESLGRVLNADVNTELEVQNACDNITQILLPQYLVDTLGHIHNAELGYETIEGQFELPDSPSLATFAIDFETQEILSTYESLRARVITDINTTNKVSDETKAALKKAVVEMEEKYIETVEDMQEDATNDGQILFRNYIKMKLIELTISATNEYKLTSEKYGELMLTIDPDSEAAEIQFIALTSGVDTLTDEQKIIYQDTYLKTIHKRYLDGICSAQEKLKEGAKHTNDYSKQDLLNMKEYLLTQKEEAKYYTYSL